MSKPLVSIIIPVFNGASVVGGILGDALKQTERRLEVIVIDDGSKDLTKEVVRGYCKKDKRVKLITQENSGPSAARNRGIESAEGKFVMFFDADDRAKDIMVERLIATMQQSAADIVESGALVEYRDEQGVLLRKVMLTPILEGVNARAQILKSLLRGGLFHALWNKVYKTDIIRTNGIRFDVNIRNGEDLIFNLAYMHHAEVYRAIPDTLYRYQRLAKSDSITGSKRGAQHIFRYRQAMLRSLESYLGGQYCVSFQLVRLRWFISSVKTVTRSKRGRT